MVRMSGFFSIGVDQITSSVKVGKPSGTSQICTAGGIDRYWIRRRGNVRATGSRATMFRQA